MPFIKLECVGCTDRKLSFNPVKKKKLFSNVQQQQQFLKTTI
jgi:hypothetical protein